MTTKEQTILELKSKGNAYFVEKNYNEAVKAYSDALALDDSNAVLFCNRAASYLGLEQFGRAAQDATRATELDPKYTKAWSRLASAYHGIQEYGRSASAWKQAIASIPSPGTAANDKMRRDYTNNLKAEERLSRTHERGDIASTMQPIEIRYVGKLLPWQRARAMLPWLKEQNIEDSSAYVIAGAAEDLSDGHELLSKQKTGGILITGIRGVLECITNAVIMDQRCFAIRDPQFLQSIDKQILLERNETHVPESLLSEPSTFTNDIRDLHAKGGHDVSRLAITTGVRILIIRGFLTAGLTGDYSAGVDMYQKALDILEWGRQEWADVPKEERGVIFEDTFIRGVRSLHLDAYMKAWNPDQPSPKITLEGVLELSTAQIEETRAHPVAEGATPGFRLAFGDYIEGNALSAQAFYWTKVVTENKPKTSEERAKAHANLIKASKLYSQAADKYPKDDEDHCIHKKYALDRLFLAGAPLSITMPLLKSILRDLPLCQAIWRWSANNAQGMYDQFKQLEEFRDAVQEAMDAGHIPPNSEGGVSPPWADPVTVFGKEAMVQSHF
ncbi:unnamed protein product [Peniophora sp. CBMAI 1063]|nr:unnamed protein product [Peniophora sp. CBMAI 1063]